jgi:hypothetical protein
LARVLMLTNPPAIHIGSYLLVPLRPAKVRELMCVLLDDQGLAEHPLRTRDAGADSATQQALSLEQECAVGATVVWGIVDRSSQVCVGAAIARQMLNGLDLEVMCASTYAGLGITETVAEPLAEWLEDHVDLRPRLAH